jgi:exonuclease SbcC
MIPVRLAVRNFMSYTDVHEPLVLDGVHIACLSGENGAGKSTLLDAMTWALWGRSRAPTQDHLIHAGRNDMEVELEFVLAEQTYRVVRKRTRTGRGSTMLDLAVGDGESFRSISGNSVNETEAAIENLLRMSYGTFVSSSFVLQGKADSFTTSTPTERKQVLADILELSEYDRLQERSRREVQQREQQHRELEAAVRQADAELERRSEFQAEQARLEARLAELDDQLKRDGAELQLLQQRLADLLARDRELSEVSAQAAETEAEIARHTKEIAEGEAELGKNRSLLDREREIEKGFTELLAARKRDEELGGKLREYARLCDERNRLDKHVATERTRLESELRNLDDRVARLDAEASRVREHRQEEQRARQALDELAGVQERQRELELTLGQRREQEAELRGANQRLRGEMHELKAKIDALEGAPICPICRSPLDDVGREGLIQRYSTEGRAQKVEYERNLGQIQRLKAEIEELGTELDRVKSDMGRLLGAERRFATA